MRKLSSLSRQLLSEEADNTFQSKKRMQQKHTTLNIPQLLTLKYWKKKLKVKSRILCNSLNSLQNQNTQNSSKKNEEEDTTLNIPQLLNPKTLRKNTKNQTKKTLQKQNTQNSSRKIEETEYHHPERNSSNFVSPLENLKNKPSIVKPKP